MAPSTVAGVSEPRPDARPDSLGAARVEDPLLDPPAGLPPEVRRRLWLLGTDTGLKRLRLGLAGLVVLATLAFIAVGANRPADPTLSARSERTPPTGFGQTAFRITAADGTTEEGCAVAAEAEAQWQEGFMDKRALPGYRAMIFAFPEDRDGAFFNKNVPITLDIAWFGSDGSFVDSATMPPCLNTDSCPLFAPQAPYRFAVEAPQGGLAPLGVGPGSRLEITGECDG